MVNIRDFDVEKVEGDRLDEIFKEQKALMEKYHDIEKATGLLQTDQVPVNIHDKHGQARLKDFAWRVTEELGEALEAFEIHSDIEDHYDEELADALHFLVEMTILAGIDTQSLINEVRELQENGIEISESEKGLHGGFDKLTLLYVSTALTDAQVSLFLSGSPEGKRDEDIVVYMTGKFIRELAKACNFLKNKPWKQSQMLTDVKRFRKQMAKTWQVFIQLAIEANITADRLFELYVGKNKVNKFRQRSNY